MKTTIKLLSILLLITIIISCNRTTRGNGKVVTKTIPVSGFTGLSVKGAYEVYLKQGLADSLVIEADSNLFNIIKTEVIDSVLYIENQKTILRSKKLKITLIASNLHSLAFTGATELTGDSALQFTHLNLNISGAGKICLNLTAKSLNAMVSGGADMVFSGKTQNLSVSISGAGNLTAFNLLCNVCKIDITGFGKAKVNVLNNLEVNISGAGKVEYKGNPIIKQSITGAGKVFKNKIDSIEEF